MGPWESRWITIWERLFAKHPVWVIAAVGLFGVYGVTLILDREKSEQSQDTIAWADMDRGTTGGESPRVMYPPSLPGEDGGPIRSKRRSWKRSRKDAMRPLRQRYADRHKKSSAESRARGKGKGRTPGLDVKKPFAAGGGRMAGASSRIVKSQSTSSQARLSGRLQSASAKSASSNRRLLSSVLRRGVKSGSGGSPTSQQLAMSGARISKNPSPS